MRLRDLIKQLERKAARQKAIGLAIELYLAGKTSIEAGDATGLSSTTVRKYVRASGHPVRRTGPLPARSPDNLALVSQLVRSGVPYSQIAKRMRIAPATALELAKMARQQGCNT